ncbi:MAG: hypothetical protein QOF53_3182, partial [Nocardioidaceae bacterium]|nr:hypothetical protein [Nocardioidaceae bacterium]
LITTGTLQGSEVAGTRKGASA